MHKITRMMKELCKCGVIHKDLKISNILILHVWNHKLNDKENIELLDFWVKIFKSDSDNDLDKTHNNF
jgi:RIO-like serine/threonine protein kinase